MTPLAKALIRRIRSTGPISLADYMSECLLHPTFGYYTTQVPFGADGDFITAPEISQMFGEVLGLCLAQAWVDQGSPNPFTLAELGPGRGTLMADVLRATRNVPGFLNAARVTLIEASSSLRERQRLSLGGHPAIWTDTVDQLPDAPLFLLANEFFDALPIRQFLRHPEGWSERLVGLANDRLAFGLGAPLSLAMLELRLSDTAPGDIVETCQPASSIVARLSSIIATHGGAALIVDYGDWRSHGDTFQAVRNHQPVDPLAEPGLADLTAHIDFEALAIAALPCPSTAMTPQGVLLERLGITARAQKLGLALTGAALDAHIAAHRRLTHPEEMGRLFKALALYAPGSPPPPGFD